MSIVTALASLGNNLVIAKNNAGQYYIPAYGLNTIGNMLPGQGYYLYLSADGTLTYPPNTLSRISLPQEMTPNSKVLNPVINNTGNNAVLLLDMGRIYDGNEVGVWNTQNELIGSGYINNGYVAVTIWGDDETTDNREGAIEGELLTVKMLNSANNITEEISLSSLQEISSGNSFNSLSYMKDGIFTGRIQIAGEPTSALTITNVPNPFTSQTVVEYNIPSDGTVEINVYGIDGTKLSSLVNNEVKAGTYKVTFDATNLASGTYNLVMRFGSQIVTRTMLIVK